MSAHSLPAFAATCALLCVVSLAGAVPSLASEGAAPAAAVQGTPLPTTVFSARIAAACYPAGHRCETADQCCDGLVCIGRSKGSTRYHCTKD